jgi:CHAT domain-containing protein
MFDDDRWRKLAAACVADSVASQERSRNGGRRPVWQDLDDDGVLALAWALKAEAQAAWNVEPSRAGQCAQALTAMLRARPLTAAEPLRDWTDGIAELAAGHSERALTALSRAGIGFAALGDRQSAAECVVPRLVSLALLGRHDEALAVGHSGLAEFVATGDLRSAGKIEINMASLLHRLARPGEAAVLYRSAAVRLARCGDAEHSVMADIGLANALTLALDFDEALRINERARVRAERVGLPVLQAHGQGAIGRIELHRGHHAAALAALAEALRLHRAAGSPPLRVLEAESALADAYLAVRLLPEAIRLYEQIATHAHALASPNTQAWALMNRGRALAALGEESAALQSMTQARSLFRDSVRPASEAFAALGVGALHLAAGRIDLARQSAVAALGLLADGDAPAWHLEAQVLQAQVRAREALLRRLDPSDGPGDRGAAAALAALKAARLAAIGLAGLEQRCLLAEGELALASGDRNAAKLAFEGLLAVLERERAALPDDEFRVALAHDAEIAHRGLVTLAAAAGDPQALLAAIDRTSNPAWGLADVLALGPHAGVGSSDVVQARQRLFWQRDELHRATTQGSRTQQLEVQAAVRDAENALLEALRRARLGSPSAMASCGATNTRGPLLPPKADQAWVVFHYDGERLRSVVATAQGVWQYEQVLPDLATRIEALRFQIDTARLGNTVLVGRERQLLERARHHAQSLHGRLWAPLAAHLAGIRRIVLVPHGPLNGLPFAALHDGERWLAERYEWLVVPSLAAWQDREEQIASRPTRPGPPSLVALAAPAPGLDAISTEALRLCSTHQAFGRDATAYIGAQATRAALRDAARTADVLHLACHAHFRADNPAFSSLQLADGEVALHELNHWRLESRLVVLSACETGSLYVASSDEVVGLVRALNRAGAAAVVAALWTVADHSTAQLMGDFHVALAAGADAATALHLAQSQAAARGQHPFHWAAFVVHGNV